MKRRVFFAAAIVLLGVGITLFPSGKPVAFAFGYTSTCSPGSPSNYKAIVSRGAGFNGGTGTDFYGVIGDARVSSITGCSGGVGPEIDAVLPANLQLDPYIVQLGWAVCFGSSTLKCGASTTGIPSDGSLHFVYICNDASNGTPCVADSWAGLPIVGDRYRFRIEKSGSSWLYTLSNVTTGASPKTKTIPRSGAFSTGNVVWWGAEAYDPGSVLGSADASTDKIHMYWMQYHRTSITGWQVAEPVTTLAVYPANVTWPSDWWHALDYSQNVTNDAQDIWTTPHS